MLHSLKKFYRFWELYFNKALLFRKKIPNLWLLISKHTQTLSVHLHLSLGSHFHRYITDLGEHVKQKEISTMNMVDPSSWWITSKLVPPCSLKFCFWWTPGSLVQQPSFQRATTSLSMWPGTLSIPGFNFSSHLGWISHHIWDRPLIISGIDLSSHLGWMWPEQKQPSLGDYTWILKEKAPSSSGIRR